jgi:uncharacterized protein YqhQ
MTARRIADPLLMSEERMVGGQAVLEGVMMRGASTWAVAVRTPAGDVDVRSFPLASPTRRRRVLRLPVVRGFVALVKSLTIGIRALGLSANAQLAEDDEPISGPAWAGAIVAGLGLAVGLFFVVPVGLTGLFKDELGSAALFWLVEGVVRTAIFLAYLTAISRLPDLRRVFQYHGAEHKAIACLEAGEPLDVEHASRHPRLHPRCGTSFLLFVMILAIFVFAPLGLPAVHWLVLSRIVGIPLVAGLAYEVIRWAARHHGRRWVRGVTWPGMQLQKLTTREPDAAQLAVAVAALEAVLAVEDPRGAAPEDTLGMEVVA